VVIFWRSEKRTRFGGPSNPKRHVATVARRWENATDAHALASVATGQLSFDQPLVLIQHVGCRRSRYLPCAAGDLAVDTPGSAAFDHQHHECSEKRDMPGDFFLEVEK